MGKSDFKSEEKEWTSLWQVQVPSKIKMFLWRLARQSIPFGDVLQHRKMAASSSCAICGMEDSWRHSLLECNLAKCVWALEKEDITEFVGCLQEQDARAWLAQTFSSLPQEDLVCVTINMWTIWYARRKAIYVGIFQSPFSTHNFVERFISDLNLTKPKQRAAQRVHDHHPRWISPPPGFAKINVDAALSKNSKSVAVAAVARDSSGCYLGASTLVFAGVSDPEILEVLACREGLALANDLLIQ